MRRVLRTCSPTIIDPRPNPHALHPSSPTLYLQLKPRIRLQQAQQRLCKGSASALLTSALELQTQIARYAGCRIRGAVEIHEQASRLHGFFMSQFVRYVEGCAFTAAGSGGAEKDAVRGAGDVGGGVRRIS